MGRAAANDGRPPIVEPVPDMGQRGPYGPQVTICVENLRSTLRHPAVHVDQSVLAMCDGDVLYHLTCVLAPEVARQTKKLMYDAVQHVVRERGGGVVVHRSHMLGMHGVNVDLDAHPTPPVVAVQPSVQPVASGSDGGAKRQAKKKSAAKAVQIDDKNVAVSEKEAKATQDERHVLSDQATADADAVKKESKQSGKKQKDMSDGKSEGKKKKEKTSKQKKKKKEKVKDEASKKDGDAADAADAGETADTTQPSAEEASAIQERNWAQIDAAIEEFMSSRLEEAKQKKKKREAEGRKDGGDMAVVPEKPSGDVSAQSKSEPSGQADEASEKDGSGRAQAVTASDEVKIAVEKKAEAGEVANRAATITDLKNVDAAHGPIVLPVPKSVTSYSVDVLKKLAPWLGIKTSVEQATKKEIVEVVSTFLKGVDTLKVSKKRPSTSAIARTRMARRAAVTV